MAIAEYNCIPFVAAIADQLQDPSEENSIYMKKRLIYEMPFAAA